MAPITQITATEVQAELKLHKDKGDRAQRASAAGPLYMSKTSDGANVSVTKKNSKADGVVLLVHKEDANAK